MVQVRGNFILALWECQHNISLSHNGKVPLLLHLHFNMLTKNIIDKEIGKVYMDFVVP